MEKAPKEKASAPSTSNQQDSLGEGSGSVSRELDHQEPGKEEGEELAVKEVSFAKLNTRQGSYEGPLRGLGSVLTAGQPLSAVCPRGHDEHFIHPHCSSDP